jgi:hypothetical protein
MTEYTVHFQKGTRVGARSMKLVMVEASTIKQAAIDAKKAFPEWKERGYRLVRVDHFEGNDIVIDW